ncbi:MAG: VanZ family protein [Candidatus Wallbacteria bacterium]|nr:VanZ family protein [Candidatus Wallbacteria bacterium]
MRRITCAWWALTFFYLCVMFYLSGRTRLNPALSIFPGEDKLLHFIEYSGLGFLLFRSLTISGLERKPLLTAFLIASLYGGFDEIHQHFVPGRESGWLDFIADAIGSWAGARAGQFLFFFSRPYLR